MEKRGFRIFHSEHAGDDFLVDFRYAEINMRFDVLEVLQQLADVFSPGIIHGEAAAGVQSKETFEQTAEAVMPGQVAQEAHSRLRLPQIFQRTLLRHDVFVRENDAFRKARCS